jgi:hypothetical protein
MIIRAFAGIILSAALAIGGLYAASEFFGVSGADPDDEALTETGADAGLEGLDETDFQMGLDDWAMSAQGDWTSIDDAASRIRIEGPVFQEFYDGALVLERRIEWRYGCDGAAPDMPAFVMFDPETGQVENCTFLLDIDADEMGFARIGLRTQGAVADRIYSELNAPLGLDEWASYMQGDWIENGGRADARLRFEGSTYREFSGGRLVSEREIQWRFGCAETSWNQPAFVLIDPATGAPDRCIFVRYIGLELIGLRASDADDERQYIVPNFPL